MSVLVSVICFDIIILYTCAFGGGKYLDRWFGSDVSVFLFVFALGSMLAILGYWGGQPVTHVANTREIGEEVARAMKANQEPGTQENSEK